MRKKIKLLLEYKLAIFMSASSLLAVFCALLICGVMISQDVLCWFTPNKIVNANGMTSTVLSPVGDIEVWYAYSDKPWGNTEPTYTQIDITTQNLLECMDLYPGEKHYYKIKIINTGDDEMVLTEFGFSKPTAQEENPIIEDGKYYYLGSQLKVSDFYVDGTTVKKNQFFMSNTGSLVYFEKKVNNIPNKVLYNEELTLSGNNGEIVFDFAISFFNNKTENQNVYKGFFDGNEGGYTCARRIYLIFK